jgi:anti-sigma B factor antagonist
MNITIKNENDALVLLLDGKLSTGTAPDLMEAMTQNAPKTEHLVFDFAGVTYVASAGLRVLIAAEQTMAAKNGKFSLRHVGEVVLEVLEMTGMDNLFEIEA